MIFANNFKVDDFPLFEIMKHFMTANSVVRRHLFVSGYLGTPFIPFITCIMAIKSKAYCLSIYINLKTTQMYLSSPKLRLQKAFENFQLILPNICE